MNEDLDFDLDFDAGLPSATPPPADVGSPGAPGMSAPITTAPTRPVAPPREPPLVPFGPTLPRPALPPLRVAMGGPIEEANGAHTLGLAFLLTGVGGAIGATYLGMYGGFGGGLTGGALANLVRAYKYSRVGTEEGSKEAMISGTYSVIGLAVAGYLFYQAYQRKRVSA